MTEQDRHLLAILGVGVCFMLMILTWTMADIYKQIKRFNDREDKKVASDIADAATRMYEARYGEGGEFIPDGQYYETR